MANRRGSEDLRLAFPRLEPEDVLVEQLAAAARSSRPTAAGRRSLQGLRVGLVTAGVVGVSVGGAWAAGNLVEREGQAPGRPPATTHAPISPEAEVTPGPPAPVSPPAASGPRIEPRGHGRPDHAGVPGRPDHAGVPGKPDHAGRPDGVGGPDHAGVPGRPDHAGVPGRPDHAGPPAEHPGKGHAHGKGKGKGQPQGPGDRRRSDHPR